MSEIRQLFGQTIIYGLSSVVARVLNFLLVPLYTAKFIPSEYAVVTEMYVYAALFIIIGSFGMETAFFRFTGSSQSSKASVFSTAYTFLLANATLILGLGLVFYKKISSIIEYENNPEYVLIFLVIIFLDLITTIPFSLLRQRNKAIKFATIKIINIAINIFFNIFFLVVCPYLEANGISKPFVEQVYNPDISVAYVFISNLIASMITVIILAPETIKNLAPPNYKLFKKMINYSWPIWIAGLAFMINESADKVLIKYLLPKGIAMREMGIYSACYKLSIFMTLFVQSYRFAAEPFFFNQFSKPNAKKTYSLMLQFFVLFALSVFLFVTFYIDVIKLIIPNSLYHEGIIIVPIVLLANIFLGIYYNLSVWYKVTNKTKYAAIISSIGAFVTVFLNIIFIPVYGYIGSAWATLICYFLMMAISFYLGQQKFKIKYNIYSICSYFLVAFVLFFASIISGEKAYMNIQIDNTIFFGLYIIFMYTQVKKIIIKKNNFY